MMAPPKRRLFGVLGLNVKDAATQTVRDPERQATHFWSHDFGSVNPKMPINPYESVWMSMNPYWYVSTAWFNLFRSSTFQPWMFTCFRTPQMRGKNRTYSLSSTCPQDGDIVTIWRLRPRGAFVVDVAVETLPDVSCFLDRDGVLPTLRETAKGRAWLQVSLLVSSFD